MPNNTYITGNNIKQFCLSHNYYYSETDNVEQILRTDIRNAVLFTHNGDRCITDEFLPYLNSNKIRLWFAQNCEIEHTKLHPLPIGIANEQWPHGNVQLLNSVIAAKIPKSKIAYANFTISTYQAERLKCWRHIYPVQNDIRRPFADYLTEVAKSYFTIAPRGNGVDCHRTWEALYLKSIPVITYSQIKKEYHNFPMLVINSWQDFDVSTLTVDLYNRMWDNFDTSQLYMDALIRHIQGIIHE